MDELTIQRIRAALSRAYALRDWHSVKFLLAEQSDLIERFRLSKVEDFVDAKGDGVSFMLSLCRAAGPHLQSPIKKEWLEILDFRRESLIAALQAANDDQRLEICALIWRFWLSRSLFQEGLEWTRAALLDNSAAGSIYYAEVALAVGTFLLRLSRHIEALAYLDQAVEIAIENRSPRVLAGAYDKLGSLFREMGDASTGVFYYSLSWYVAEKEDDESGIAQSLNNLGVTAWDIGAYKIAQKLVKQSVRYFVRCGDSGNAAKALNNLGILADKQQKYTVAIDSYNGCLRIFRKMGNRMAEALVLYNLGDSYLHCGDVEKAEKSLHASLRIRLDIGYYAGVSRAFEALADLSIRQIDPERAVRLLGAAAALREIYPLPLSPSGMEELQRIEQQAKEMMPLPYEAAWAAGYAMTIDDAIRFAIESTD